MPAQSIEVPGAGENNAASGFSGTDWKESPLRLEFALGNVSLFAIKYNALVRTDPMTFSSGSPICDLPEQTDVAIVYEAQPPIGSAEMRSLRFLRRVIRYVPQESPRYCIDLTGSFQDYQAKFSSKSRYTLRKKLRRLEHHSGGTVECREFRTPSEAAEFLEIAQRLPISRFSRTVLEADVGPYRLDILLLAVRASLRAYVLFANTTSVAYLCCIRDEQTVAHWISGYDPAFKEFSPGVLLQYLALERLFAEKAFRLFDFVSGGGQHKAFFATGMLNLSEIYYFRRTFWNTLSVMLHAAFSFGTRKIVELIRVLGILPFARRIRSIMAPPLNTLWRRSSA